MRDSKGRFVIGSDARCTHGMSKTTEYAIWSRMHARCNNPHVQQYADYGGRGISVCPEWSTFEQFFADMGPRPKNQSLDRIDCNGNYSAKNCRWATRFQQAQNRRITIYLTIDGVSKTLKDWVLETHIREATIRARLKKGWCHKAAVFRDLISDERKQFSGNLHERHS